MRFSQLPLLGLLLALLVGTRVGTPGTQLGSNDDTANKPQKKSPQPRGGSPAGPANALATNENCDSLTASAKDKLLSLSISPPGSRPCVSPLPPVWKEICKLNPSYHSDSDLPSKDDLEASREAFLERCLVGNTPAKERPVITSIMASVANPLRTHLGLTTDRTIEAIQVAAAEANFLPQSHYLPWPALPSSSDSQTSPESQDQSDPADPGVLIFRNNDAARSSPQYLAVFLIPELPTEGLDRKVFAAAESIVEQVSPRSAVLFFAGPTFSGSWTSLEEINRNLVPNKCILAFSGSVTNPRLDTIQEPDCFSVEPTLKLTQTTDDKALLSFISGAGTFGYRPDEIAILSEEGTQYGTRQSNLSAPPETHPLLSLSATQHKGPLLILHFPREISKLRNAYGAEASSATQAASASPQTDLQLSWQDSEATRGDDVQTYGRGQTPLSQETALSTLSITLKARNIKALGILATDPMDVAFLIHSIKQSSPDVRLFLRNPDLLYLRTPDVASLNGTLLVSNTPLIPQNQFWSSPQDADQNRLITFPSASQESQYNAFVLLLEKAGLAPPSKKKMKLLEWGWPSGKSADAEASLMGGTSRPLWLATIGTATNYPVKILNSEGVDESRLALHSLDLGKPQFAPLLLWASIALLGILHAFGLRYKDAVPSALKPDFDLTDENSAVTLVRRSCHLVAILTITLAQLILGSSYLFFWSSDVWYKLAALAVALVTLGLLGVVGLQVRTLCLVQLQQKRLAVPYEGTKIIDIANVIRGTVIAGSIIVLAGMAWLLMTMPSHFENAFFHFRNLNLASGVAVALPIASVLLVIYCGLWAYLRRVAYWERQYVEMFDLSLDPVIRGDLSAEGAAIGKCLIGRFDDEGWWVSFWLTLVLFVLTFRPWRTLDIIEPLEVWCFLFFFFVLALVIVWLNCFRFLNIWVHLRNILEHLEKLPIRTAFCRLPRQKSSPILQWGESRSALLPLVLDRLRALKKEYGTQQNVRLLEDFEAKVIALTKHGVVETAIVERKVVGGPPRRILRTFSISRKELVQGARDEMTTVIDTLSGWLLKEYWSRGSSGTKEGQEPKPVDLKFVLAEDIVALPFYAYIHRVIGELRNILFFLGIAVSLLFAALHTYAFRADQAIDWWFFGLFAFLGGGIALIIAQMERNALLSRLTNTTPGELGAGFYLELLKYGAIPFLTIVGSQVPSVSNLVLKWIQPALQALH
jgi:hypothetical protein